MAKAREQRVRTRREKLHALSEKLEKRLSVQGKNGVVVTFDGVASIKITRGPFNRKTYIVDAHVTATVESGGNLRTHPTLTRTVALGGVAGAAWWKKTGSLFLLFEGKDWADLVELSPQRAGAAQKLAQRVNLVARLARESSDAHESAPGAKSDIQEMPDPASVIDQLERLMRLREQGVVTDEEFEAQKKRILGS